MFALDTTTLIHFFKGTGNVGEKLLTCAPAEISIPAIVVYEIETGIAKSSDPAQRRAQFDRLLDVVSILPFDQAAAEKAAGIRAVLEVAGRPIGPMDTLIAGTALAYNATLVTHNRREFSRVTNLSVVDWFE